MKYHGGLRKNDLEKENLTALEAGLPNLLQHLENITKVYKLPAVVAINVFPNDTKAELELVEKKCDEIGIKAVLSEGWAKGGEGGVKLAEEAVRLCEQPNDFEFSYNVNLSIEEKINAVAKKIYRADGVDILKDAQNKIKQIEKLGLDKVPICIAKTQYSFSDDPALLGAPKGWRLTVRDVKLSAGAGFIVVLTGEIMTMPGLPPAPAAERIDIDRTGKISGLF